MLALRGLQVCSTALRPSPRLSSRRTIFTETIHVLSTAYLDLAVALPYPPSWPAYSSTIILVGVVSRLALLPVSLWARRRDRRAEEQVVPYLKAYRAKLEERARLEGVKANTPAAREYFGQIVSKKLKSKRNELFKKHRCTPWVTMLVPPVTQMPIFITLSAVFFHAVNESSSVLRDESFLTLSSLAHPDPTATFPIILGLVSLTTIETSKWFMTEERARRLAEQKQREDAQKAQGRIVIQPMKYTKSALRGLSVGRIVLAAMAPGSIEIYWLTSATFGLFTNWAMDWSDSRRKRAHKSAVMGVHDMKTNEPRGQTPSRSR